MSAPLTQIISLLELYPPPFIYIHDTISLRFTIASFLSALSERCHSQTSQRICYVHIDGVACFTPRLLYDSVLNGLVAHTPKWANGCANWSEQRYNESLDAFLHGLKDAHSFLSKQANGTDGTTPMNVRLVIVIEKPEKMKERMPDLLVPLTRLAELANLDLSVVFISEVRWDNIRPSLGAALDPYYVDIPIPTKEAAKEMVMQHLSSIFLKHSTSTELASTSSLPHPYDPVLQPLYNHFISVLFEVGNTYTKDPYEFQYVAAARWPGFVKPILDAHQQAVEASTDEDPDLTFEPPSIEVMLRLTRHFKSSLSAAFEQLYPRLSNAIDWAKANEPNVAALERGGLFSRSHNEVDLVIEENRTANTIDPQSSPTRSSARIQQRVQALERVTASPLDVPGSVSLPDSLPHLSQYILVAAYIASMNPAKSDLRMFGRGLDEKKRRRRPVRRQKNAQAKSGPVKIPQRFLGPSPFPLDRLLAILAALLEENDSAMSVNPNVFEDDRDGPIDGLDFRFPGERTDFEVSRAGIYAAISQLVSLRLLSRTTASDRLEGPSAMFKCGPGVAGSYEDILQLSKGLDIPLPDLLWIA